MQVDLPADKIAAICQQWQVSELAVFGSAANGSCSPTSDIDFLVTFAPQAQLTYFDVVRLKAALERLAGREVDLVISDAIRNPYRRHNILSTREVIYAV
jgi:hypothetical protein